MSVVIIAAVVVAAIGIRVWRHRRRSERTSTHARSPLWLGSATSDIGLIAARELRERIRGRVLRVGTLVILAVIAAAIVIPVLTRSSSTPERVGVVGSLTPAQHRAVTATAKTVGTKISVVVESGIAAARRGLRTGRLDVVIVGGRELVGLSPSAVSGDSYIQALSTNLGIVDAIASARLTPSQVSTLERSKPLPIATLVGGSGKSTVHGSSIFGIILVFVMLNQYNTWILIGVLEEKMSRVAEVLLAAVRPVQLLAGKVLGIGMVAIAQATLIVAFALVLERAVGSDLLKGTAPLTLAATLVWLLAGYGFYCWVYAAAGSMVARQDQVQSLAFPLSLPIIFGYITALIAVSTGSASLLIRVLAYLPPTAPFAMPVLVSFGDVAWWQFAASLLISIVCTYFVARFAATIYRRAILRTGRRVSLREVLARG